MSSCNAASNVATLRFRTGARSMILSDSMLNDDAFNRDLIRTALGKAGWDRKDRLRDVVVKLQCVDDPHGPGIEFVANHLIMYAKICIAKGRFSADVGPTGILTLVRPSRPDCSATTDLLKPAATCESRGNYCTVLRASDKLWLRCTDEMLRKIKQLPEVATDGVQAQFELDPSLLHNRVQVSSTRALEAVLETVSQKNKAALLRLPLYRRGLHDDAHKRAVSALENILKAFMQHLIYWDADKLEAVLYERSDGATSVTTVGASATSGDSALHSFKTKKVSAEGTGRARVGGSLKTREQWAQDGVFVPDVARLNQLLQQFRQAVAAAVAPASGGHQSTRETESRDEVQPCGGSLAPQHGPPQQANAQPHSSNVSAVRKPQAPEPRAERPQGRGSSPSLPPASGSGAPPPPAEEGIPAGENLDPNPKRKQPARRRKEGGDGKAAPAVRVLRPRRRAAG